MGFFEPASHSSRRTLVPRGLVGVIHSRSVGTIRGNYSWGKTVQNKMKYFNILYTCNLFVRIKTEK